jgi:arginyl-tRNA synthetase
MPSVQRLLDRRVTAAMRAAFPESADAPAIIQPSQDPRFGDYQANGAMGLAKRLKRKPRDVAAEILARLDVADLAEPPQIAGPGFINLRLRPDWLGRLLGAINPDPRLGVPRADKAETVVVDYSAPNLAKEMHVGHLRSTIIGDALARMLDFAGHRVIRQNHVGDWGTQFGMLLAEMEARKATVREDGAAESVQAACPDIGDLEAFYRQAKEHGDAEPEFLDRARRKVVELQSGDKQALALWGLYRTISLRHCKKVYDKLGVQLTDNDIRGESAYNDDLPAVVEELRAKGLLTESQGAQCIFLTDDAGKPIFVAKDGTPLPFIVQKSDEGYLYATTDLAAIRYRVRVLRANRILYVVDARQSLHFQQLFAAARKAGFAPPDAALVHVAFGTMMGPDGRPFKTREGGTVKLMDLLDEAENRAYELVSQKGPDLPQDERRRIAHVVGIGAVKYADLAQSRTSDYAFSWEKMLSLDGNTAPYMQYAYARVRSIFRKGGHEAEEHRQEASPILLAAPAELALGKMILRMPEVLDRTLDDYRPNVLAAYLYDLAQAFTGFYDACPVIQSEGPTRANRLKLCDLTARVIAQGLGLLGIETAERM